MRHSENFSWISLDFIVLDPGPNLAGFAKNRTKIAKTQFWTGNTCFHIKLLFSGLVEPREKLSLYPVTHHSLWLCDVLCKLDEISSGHSHRRSRSPKYPPTRTKIRRDRFRFCLRFLPFFRASSPRRERPYWNCTKKKPKQTTSFPGFHIPYMITALHSQDRPWRFPTTSFLTSPS